MTHQFLLPHKIKVIGWIILIPAAAFSLILFFSGYDAIELKAKTFSLFTSQIENGNSSQWFQIIETDITYTVASVLFLIGALLVGFSKEKKEDEFIGKLRLNALAWAVIVNYILLLAALIFVYGLAFLDVLLFNIFTVLIIFILRFHYLLYKYSKAEKVEK